MDDQRRHRRIDAAAERADNASAIDPCANPRGRLCHERRHRPVAGTAADAVCEIAEDFEAALRVRHFRMKKQRVQTAPRVGHRRDRRVRARAEHRKTGRRRRDEIAVARPDFDFVGHAGKERRPVARPDRT